jgi:hypothetical protein
MSITGPSFGVSADAEFGNERPNKVARFVRFLAYDAGELSNQLGQTIDPVWSGCSPSSEALPQPRRDWPTIDLPLMSLIDTDLVADHDFYYG